MAGSREQAESEGALPSRPVAMVPLLLLAAVLGLAEAGGSERVVAGGVKAVTASNWTCVLQGEWMVKFYAPWCPACQQIESDWENFGERSKTLEVNVGKVDVTEEPGLSGRFFVTTLPTIFHAKDGVFRRYLGSRTSEELQTYILEKKWESVEPVAGWKSPSSITMYGMAGLFHLSGWIRQIHNYLTGPLGIPVWGSYVIFTLATLLIGLVLGLILVLLADCICPAKPRYREVTSAVNEEETLELSDEEQEEPAEDKKTLSDIEDEENSVSDKASGEDSAVEEGTETEEAGEDIPEQYPAEPEEEEENTVRQRQRQGPSSEL
ncbi:thioredoxin-related transmembrane protein 4 [Rhinatrema bivittatum]|uniref:thioredoxin-related transmembrane protein 4 n=1 Tax=Rhinatrema bivittatum TaxID=194408 RepID=UPI0011271521|nr:thioredoxin-related transmembrane protein 4 [Rhinatrema bivittatum]